ncbi:hypothetical protein RHSP_22289 [Rhizobium freirei PRF 81]|uniref:Uncharacterized protein n=1 Tax=Rhizobium freirei PRF 81 TaxID=363754 RepID=N6TVH5_9HYPH|nr:hypothetical protein RHSP_22289 [Rhizobium freirei PRF 81]
MPHRTEYPLYRQARRPAPCARQRDRQAPADIGGGRSTQAEPFHPAAGNPHRAHRKPRHVRRLGISENCRKSSCRLRSHHVDRDAQGPDLEHFRFSSNRENALSSCFIPHSGRKIAAHFSWNCSGSAKRQHAIGRAMTVDEGADVDDDLVAHVDAALEGRRAHMRQKYHLALIGELHQLRIDGGFVLEHVEAGAGDLAFAQDLDQRRLIDDIAARRVDDVACRLQQRQAAGGDQMIRRRRRRAVDRNDVDAGEHLVEAVPIGRLQFVLRRRIDPLAIVIMDRKAECLGAAGNGGAYAPHADNADTLAVNASPQHPGRRPSGPFAGIIRQDAGTFRQPSRDGENERHGHVGGIFGQDIGRVGHGDAATSRSFDIDMIGAVGETGNQLHLRPGLIDQLSVDAVRHRGHQHVDRSDSLNEFGLGARTIVNVEFGIEELAHPRFHCIRQFARDVDFRFFLRRHGERRCLVQMLLTKKRDNFPVPGISTRPASEDKQNSQARSEDLQLAEQKGDASSALVMTKERKSHAWQGIKVLRYFLDRPDDGRGNGGPCRRPGRQGAERFAAAALRHAEIQARQLAYRPELGLRRIMALSQAGAASRNHSGIR